MKTDKLITFIVSFTLGIYTWPVPASTLERINALYFRRHNLTKSHDFVTNHRANLLFIFIFRIFNSLSWICSTNFYSQGRHTVSVFCFWSWPAIVNAISIMERKFNNGNEGSNLIFRQWRAENKWNCFVKLQHRKFHYI